MLRGTTASQLCAHRGAPGDGAFPPRHEPLGTEKSDGALRLGLTFVLGSVTDQGDCGTIFSGLSPEGDGREGSLVQVGFPPARRKHLHFAPPAPTARACRDEATLRVLTHYKCRHTTSVDTTVFLLGLRAAGLHGCSGLRS